MSLSFSVDLMLYKEGTDRTNHQHEVHRTQELLKRSFKVLVVNRW
jgi:hypothetical protein